MEQIEEQKFCWYTELKTFGGYFIEMYLLLLIIQILSDKIDNSTINYFKDIKVATIIAIILYIAKWISQDSSDNIRQGMHYAISGAFLSQYPI
jgi:NADH:ubiquinone oxidoreductase subunit 4 (subunit M)